MTGRRDLSRTATFRIRRKAKVWRVFRNEVFYGDYGSHDAAVRAACFGARTQEAKGLRAEVFAEGQVVPFPHGEPDLGG